MHDLKFSLCKQLSFGAVLEILEFFETSGHNRLKDDLLLHQIQSCVFVPNIWSMRTRQNRLSITDCTVLISHFCAVER